MSLDYTITSPCDINGTPSSILILDTPTNSINIFPSSSLSSTYNFILPSQNGVTDQVLGLNSNLETEWVDLSNINSLQILDGVTLTISSSGVYTIIGSTSPSTSNFEITPPQGTYFCVFNCHATTIGLYQFAYFVDSSIILISSKRSGDSIESCGLIDIITVNGSETISVRVSGIFGGSIKIDDRIFVLIKLN